MNSTRLDPINHKPLSQTAYEKILRAISSGRLHPGDQITITALARELGVSLMPVREALRGLEAQNLISVQKYRRIVVREYSEHELEELLQIRLHLECLAAKKAAKNCTEETLEELEGLMMEMDEAKDIEGYLDKNLKFHHAVYRQAHMPILLEIIWDLWLNVSPYLHIYIAEVPNYKVPAKLHHNGILNGMRKRDCKEVSKWVQRDLKLAAKFTTEVLRRFSQAP